MGIDGLRIKRTGAQLIKHLEHRWRELSRQLVSPNAANGVGVGEAAITGQIDYVGTKTSGRAFMTPFTAGARPDPESPTVTAHRHKNLVDEIQTLEIQTLEYWLDEIVPDEDYWLSHDDCIQLDLPTARWPFKQSTPQPVTQPAMQVDPTYSIMRAYQDGYQDGRLGANFYRQEGLFTIGDDPEPDAEESVGEDAPA